MCVAAMSEPLGRVSLGFLTGGVFLTLLHAAAHLKIENRVLFLKFNACIYLPVNQSITQDSDHWYIDTQK